MPTYVYRCDECGVEFDRFQHFSEEPVRVCPECRASVRRVIQPVGIVFKGKGFYVTDHKTDTSSLMPKPKDDVAGEPPAVPSIEEKSSEKTPKAEKGDD
jgi:putative FmdB family regulatory protein